MPSSDDTFNQNSQIPAQARLTRMHLWPDAAWWQNVTCRSAPLQRASSNMANASCSAIGELWRGKQRWLGSRIIWEYKHSQ